MQMNVVEPWYFLRNVCSVVEGRGGREEMGDEGDLIEELLGEGCAGFRVGGDDDVGAARSVRREADGWGETALGVGETVKDLILLGLYLFGGQQWR